MTRRVVITGIGTFTPYGDNTNVLWDSVINGKSAISNIENFDASEFAVKIAGEIKDHSLMDKYITPKEQKKMDMFLRYGIVASEIAIADSGLKFDTEEIKLRTGAFGSSGIGGLLSLQENHAKFMNKGPRRISPMFIPKVIINLLPGTISMRHGFHGPNMSIVSACSSGAHSIGHAALAIREDRADVMIAGAAEAAVCELGIGGFASMKALSSRNDDPTHASRPWDKDRDGFIMSEGASFVVLEEYEHAKKRGAKMYAELVGYGMSGDAFHITQPAEDGKGAGICINDALRDAGLKPEDIDYVNAHGTSTPLGDLAESNAIARVFKNNLDKLNVSSTKSSTGHFLGAAGSLEVILSALALKNGIVPPTMNMENIDERIEPLGINLTLDKAVKKDMKYALSNSFGFGGTNSSVILKKI